MSYLYEHREQLGENSRLAEIAYSVTFSIPPDDRDDVEQKIVIELIEVKKRVTAERYLWKTARHLVGHYWQEQYSRLEKSCYMTETNRGEITDREWQYLSAPDGTDARLDAVAVLSALPPRMIEIGLKKLNGERLTNAERLYRQKKRNKLRPDHSGRRISKSEKQKIVELNRKGLKTNEIARVTGRSVFSVKSALKEAGLSSPYLAQAERARAGKEKLIRQAYFVDRKSINRIARENHIWKDTVRRVVRAGPIETVAIH